MPDACESSGGRESAQRETRDQYRRTRAAQTRLPGGRGAKARPTANLGRPRASEEASPVNPADPADPAAHAVTGPAGMRELFRTFGRIDQTWTIDDTIAEGDKVVVRATNSCLQESFLGIPADGAAI